MPYDFIPNQSPSILLQGEDIQKYRVPLADKARERAQHTLEAVGLILKGQKPLLGGSGKGHKFIMAQADNMWRNGLIPEPQRAYYDKIPPKQVIGLHPVAAAQVFDREHLEAVLGSRRKSTIHVLGTSITARDPKQQEKIQRDADLFICVPGEFRAMDEFASIFLRKKDGEKLPPLIIENTRHFWDPMLQNLKVLKIDHNRLNPDGTLKNLGQERQYIDLNALASHFGIYISESRDQTVALAKTLQKKIPKKEAHDVKPVVTKDATIFVATGTAKKYEELARIYSAQGLNVKIRPIDQLVDGFISPKETSGTYEGNAEEKIRAAHKAWTKMTTAERADRLEALNLKEENIFFLAEDSGFHFAEQGLAKEPEFKDIEHKIPADLPFPGVETGPSTIGSHGVANFFNKIGQILARRDNPDRSLYKKSILALSPLLPSRTGEPDIYMVSSEVKGTFTATPRPAGGAIEIDNFLIPNDGSGKTEAELGDEWVISSSPRAVAWKALAYEMGIEQGKKAAKVDYEKTFTAGIVVDDSHHAAKILALKLEKEGTKKGFRCKKLSPQTEALSDVQNNILEHSDGVILAFDPEMAKHDFWRNLWTFSSLIVGEQTRDKFKVKKPVYLLNPKDGQGRGAFSDLEDLTYDLHILGTIPQDPKTLYKSVSSIEEAVNNLKEDRKKYFRYHPPAYAKGPEFPAKGNSSAKKFNVAIFTSATNENGKVIEASRELAKSLIQNDFGLVTGAGLYSGMGAITNVADEMRQSHKVHHRGVTVPHIMDSVEVGGVDIEQSLDEFKLTRDIYERIDQLLQADAAIVAPGGMGTVQELAGFAYLKKRYMETHDPALEGFKDKELVILNSQIEVAGKHRGFYDELIKIIPPDQMEALGIHVVDDVRQAVDKMLELRDRKIPPEHLSTSPLKARRGRDRDAEQDARGSSRH